MALVYRYFDQETLDREYNARSTVPDIWPILSHYSEGTAQARASLPCHVGLPYGATEAERLDVFPARQGAGLAPVFIYIHGGYWRLLDAADSGFMAPAFTGAGACVVALNYALAPGVSLDEIVRQCRAALSWIHRHIAEYGGDPGRIHVAGSSAGGHLAAMMAAPGWQGDFGLPETAIAGATLLSGLFDLEPVMMTHVNEWLHLDLDSARKNSPINHLPANPVPLIFSYGPGETSEFKRQTEIHLAACQAVGCACEFVAMPGTNHFDIVLALRDPASALTRAIWRTMGLDNRAAVANA